MHGLRAFCVVLAFLVLGASAQAEKRVALVIGNSTYRSVPALINPINDAADISVVFERLGFSVRTITNATYDDMRRGLLTFGRQVRNADIAVVFFAGHGIEVAGENWLIPVDEELRSDLDVEHEAMSLRSLLPAVENAGKLGLVILDACRNNPFNAKMQRTIRTRAVSRGLAGIEPSGNVLVAYSAKDGTTAADGDGRNSPFTASLLKHLETPGLEINFLFRNVRDEVIKSTRRVQQPFVYGSLSKEAIYLKDAPPQFAITPPPPGPSADELTWGFLRDTSDPDALQRFVQQYPKSPHRAEADRRISFLTQVQSAAAQAIEQRMAALAAEAQQAKARPAGPSPEDVAWGLVKDSKDANQFRLFLDKFPASPRRGEAERRTAELTAAQHAAAETLEKKLAAMNAEQRAASKALEQKMAALTAEAEKAKAAPGPQIDPRDMARLLQLELKRVGCFDGAVNGKLDSSTRGALKNFSKLASLSLPDDELSNDTLKIIRGVDKRVCPLVCKSGERVDGEHCIRIVCPSGQLMKDGSCVAKPDAEPKKKITERPNQRPNSAAPAAPATPSGGRGGKCFAFNGRTFCE